MVARPVILLGICPLDGWIVTSKQSIKTSSGEEFRQRAVGPCFPSVTGMYLYSFILGLTGPL